jgi:chemotaxis protein MotB
MALVAEEEKAGVAEWVVTFGDMMSLLLTFFVLLFSMSEIKQDQSVALLESLRRQFGNSKSSVSLMAGNAPPTTAALNKLPSLGRAKRANTMNGGDKIRAPQGDYARVVAIRPSEEATQGGVIYFEEGQSDLTEEHRKTLEASARAIGGKPQKIEIRGHTSTRPLAENSPYRDHWDLAYSRCRKVREYLTRLGINSKRIRVGVAAENEPIHIGYDELLRKKNSRVEILIHPELIEDLEGTDEERRKKYSSGMTP